MSVHGAIWDAAHWPDRWTVRHVAETGSTNADLLADLDAGLVGERSVLVTDHQTAGRGRLDRRWDAPPGTNLLVSIALAPVPSVPVEATHRVGLAALSAVREVRPDARVALKWPNDLLLDHRKLAGILAQRSSTRDAVVVGLGLNVAWAPDGAARLGSSVRPGDVLARLLAHVDELDGPIGPRYRSELSTIGQRVRLELPAGAAVEGTAIDVDAAGRLVVRSDDGVVSAFEVGDVVHVRPGENRV